jgi:hypothetical protein
MAATKRAMKKATATAGKPKTAGKAVKSTPKAAKSTPKAAKSTPKAAKSTPKAAKSTPKAAKSAPKAAKSTTKAAKSTTKAAKSAAGVRIASITPTKDGAHWTLVLTSGARAKVASAPAQSAGVKVGGPWSAAVAQRVLEAAIEQEMFTRAMSLLARDGRMARADLAKELGSDPRARRTVASLVKHGWIA